MKILAWSLSKKKGLKEFASLRVPNMAMMMMQSRVSPLAVRKALWISVALTFQPMKRQSLGMYNRTSLFLF
jgi:hypothetical protein